MNISEKKNIIKNINKLLYNSMTAIDLPIMNLMSFKYNNINILSNNYSVSDKADG
jgi:hypothetical protein